MLTLLSECHFWTNRDDIQIKSNDFGALRYTKKDSDAHPNIHSITKKDYHEKRGHIITLTNRKPSRLKFNLRKLEELLKCHRIIKSEWKDSCVIQILLSNGIFVHICVNIFTGDIIKMAFDKYFVGKLAAETITDVVISRQNIVLAYNTNQITVVNLQKPKRHSGPEKIANMDPKIFHVLIPGPTERRLARHLVVNSSFDLIVVWTKSSQNELFPWRPTVRDQDQANMHAFKLRSGKLESIGFCWTENDPICAQFLRISEGQILTVEQKVSRKGEITAEICFYVIGKGKLHRISVKSISIGTQICCFSFSPDQEKLLLGTIDRFICVHDLVRQKTKFTSRTEIIPIHCAWHPDSTILLIGNDKSQFQCFDYALNPIANQLTSEDVTPSNLLDLSHYFTIQPNLLNISFSFKPDLCSFTEDRAQTDCFLMLIFDNGPIGVLRFFAGAGICGDVHNSGLTADVLCNKYLTNNQLEKSVNLLLSTNWETYGAMCLISLHKISNYVLTRMDTKRSRNELFNLALKSFSNDLSEETRDEFADQVLDLKRRFFFFLLRHKLYTECFELARDIEDYDLFMDLYNCTKSDSKLLNFSQESYRQAELALSKNDSGTTAVYNVSREDNDDSTSLCSQSSCSDCLKNDEKKDLQNQNVITELVRTSPQYLIVKRYQKNRTNGVVEVKPNSVPVQANVSSLKNYVPPLPYFKSPILNAENIKIKHSKSELRRESLLNIPPMIGNSNMSLDHEIQHYGLRNPRLPELNGSGSELSSVISVNLSQNVPHNHNRFINKFHSITPNPQLISSHHSNSSNIINMNRNMNYNFNKPFPPLNYKNSSEQLPINWNNIPDQTLGIPTVANPPLKFKPLVLASSNQILPRASTLNADLSGVPVQVTSNILHQNIIPPPQQQIHEHIHGNFIPLANASAFGTENIYSPKYYQHPIVLGNIPPTSISHPGNVGLDALMKLRKPAASILSNSSSVVSNGGGSGSSTGGFKDNPQTNGINAANKKDFGEKNKVKFSDTVQVAVVPEIQRKEKPHLPKRTEFLRKHFTDPQRELADSLPLCHPNEEYLKDFNPVSEPGSTMVIAANNNTNNNNEQLTESYSSNNNINNNISNTSDKNNTKTAPTIKVVHFGIV